MLNKLEALTCRQPGNHWKVSGDAIVQEKGEKSRLQNLFDFIRSVSFTTQVLCSPEGQLLTKGEAARVFKPIVDTSIKLQLSIEKLPLWKRVFLTIVQYLFTGTTLAKATLRLQNTVVQIQHLDNTYAAKLRYPHLVQDAQTALKDAASYKEVATHYTLPRVVQQAIANRSAMPCMNLSNPLLYYLRQAVVSEWKEMRSLLRQGKSIEDQEVMNCCDAALQLSLLLARLSVTHELESLYEKRDTVYDATERRYHLLPTENKRQHLSYVLAHQRGYPYWAVSFVGQLYKEIRSYPTYNAGSKFEWLPKFALHRPFMEQFYQEGTRPSFWRNSFNEFCRLIPEHVDREEFLRQDHRFYVDEDTLELLNKPEESVFGKHLTSLFEDEELSDYLFTSSW
jgi:hypothetical protein